MSYACIEFNVEDDVGVLRLNRPESLNSFTAEMHQETRDVFKRLGDSDRVRCLLLTGTGRGFCAGQDLKDVGDQDLGDIVERDYNPLIQGLAELELPVICAVNGIAAGAGASLAMACDIVLAARSASFMLAFSKIGLIPDSGATWNLLRAIGLSRSKALAMLSEKISAEKAESWGLIWKCVDDDALMDEALSLAKFLATQPTKAMARIKQALHVSSSSLLASQLALESSFMRELGQSHDYREGVASFVEKRKPVFKGE